MISPDDKTLIKQILRDDKSALNLLYHRHKSYWFRICLRYASEKVEAEEIFQEAATKVFKELGKYNSEKGSFKAWSNRVLIHEILKTLKRHQWKHAFSGEESLQNIASWNGEILEGITAKEVTRLIQSLPLGYRIVFNMYEIEGYNHQEIADTLGISIGTSKSQLSRAKKILKQQIHLLFK